MESSASSPVWLLWTLPRCVIILFLKVHVCVALILTIMLLVTDSARTVDTARDESANELFRLDAARTNNVTVQQRCFIV